MASKRFPTPQERVRFLPSVPSTPRSSSRPGCRPLKPVTRVRIPLGALHATVVSVGSTRRCQRCGPGSIPGGRSHGALGGQRQTHVACNHASGVQLPGAPLVDRSRTRLVARPGCLPGEAGSTPVESASLAVLSGTERHPATVEDGGSNPPGESTTTGRLGGAALIRRSSVVRFHGRRCPTPRSSAAERRASTPRCRRFEPCRGARGCRCHDWSWGDGPPRRLRAPEIAGSNPPTRSRLSRRVATRGRGAAVLASLMSSRSWVRIPPAPSIEDRLADGRRGVRNKGCAERGP